MQFATGYHFVYCKATRTKNGSAQVMFSLVRTLFAGPRECNVCGELATHECRECYANGSNLDEITFCKNCLVKVSKVLRYCFTFFDMGA